jgi:putative tricarboxylic transport membrane protein
MGAWMDTSTYGDWVTLIIAGIVGYLMKRGGWPRPPIILAFILGAIMENSFLITMNIHLGFGWLARPIVLIILAIIAITIVASMRRNQSSLAGLKAEEAQSSLDEIPIVSTGLGVFLILIFLGFMVLALDWSYSVRLFPISACIFGAVMCGFALVQGSLRMRKIGLTYDLMDNQRQVLSGMVQFLLIVSAIVVGALVIGQKLVIPIFILFFCRLWAGFSWQFSMAYAVAGWIVLVGFYESVLTIFWQPSYLGELAKDMLGAKVPMWLLF